MKKLILFLTCFLLLSFNVNAQDLNINSKYAYVYNLSLDKAMYEKNSDEEIKVASLTKIMTAIIVIENNKDLDSQITILDEDLKDMYEYTTVGFKNKDRVTIRDLLYGILLKSGSDAVNAAVRITASSQEQFVDMMNQKVKELSLTHTHFSNPIGKDEENYSSAHDIAKIMEYCLKNKTFKEIISTNYYKYDDLDIEISGPLYGSLEKYGIDLSIVNGAKSGYTTEAKHCLVSYSEAKDTKYIVVTNQANDYKELLNDTFNIYNYFYTNYDYFNYDIDFNIDIENGKESKYSVKLSPKLYLNKDFDQSLITYKYNGTKKITFLKNKGDKLGSVSIYYDKDLIKTVDVKLNSDLKFKSKAYTKVIISFIIILIVLILAILGLFKFKTKKNKKVKTITNVKVQPKTDNFTILKTTTNIKLFFETIKKINNSEKEKIEHDFIDRCFKNIDFKNEKDLKKLNEDLKTHKEEMCTTTVKYYNTLFKYCIKKYINNN